MNAEAGFNKDEFSKKCREKEIEANIPKMEGTAKQ